MIELAIILCIIGGLVLLVIDAVQRRSAPRHRWTEVDSADVAHALRRRARRSGLGR